MQRSSTRRSVLAGIAGTTAVPVAAGPATAHSTEPEDWETTLDAEGDITLDDVVVLADGGLLAVGREQLEWNRYGWAAGLARDGTLRWSKRIRNEGGEFGTFSAVAPTPDGGAVAVGYTRRPHDADVDVAGWVVRFDQAGAVVRQSTIAGDQPMGFSDLVGEGDGFAVAGRRMGAADFGATIVWLDADGRERDRSVVEREATGPGFEAITANDGGYCLVGHASGPESDETPDTVGYAMGLDRDATPRWRETVPRGQTLLFTDAVPDGDGGFLLVGMRLEGRTLETLHWQGEALRVDDAGRRRWHETYGDVGRNGFRAIERTADGFLVTADGQVEGETEVSDPRLVALDSSGDVAARTHLGEPDLTRRPQAIATPEPGRAAVVGNDDPETDPDVGFALETATPSGSPGDDGGILSAPMPGPGMGAALGGLAVGAGLLAARRRTRDD